MITVGTDTYISTADAASYIALMGLASLSDAEPLLKRATQSIDRLYSGRYIGTKASITQPLHWPRIVQDDTDADGNIRDFTSIPVDLGQATVELALLIDAGSDVFAQPDPMLISESVQVDVIKQTREFASAYASNVHHKVSLALRALLVSPSTVRLVRG